MTISLRTLIAVTLLTGGICIAGQTAHFSFDNTLNADGDPFGFLAVGGSEAFGPDHNGTLNGAIEFDRSYYLRGDSGLYDTAVYGTAQPLAASFVITVRIDDISQRNMLVNDYDSSSYDNHYVFAADTRPENGQLRVGGRTTTSGHKGWGIEGPELVPGVWYRIVATFDQVNQSAALFVNGEKFDTIIYDGIILGQSYTDGDRVFLGSSIFQGVPTGTLDGAVADLSFYDHSWTDEEVATDFSNFLGDEDDCCVALDARITDLETQLVTVMTLIANNTAATTQNSETISVITDTVSALGAEQIELGNSLILVQSDLAEAINALDLFTISVGEEISQTNTRIDEVLDQIDEITAKLSKRKSGKSHKSDKSKKSGSKGRG